MYFSVCSLSLFLHYCAFWYYLVLQKLDVPHVLSNRLEYLTKCHHFFDPSTHSYAVCLFCVRAICASHFVFMAIGNNAVQFILVCDQKANIACIKTLNDFYLFVTFALLFCIVAVVVTIILNVHNLSQAQQKIRAYVFQSS